LRTSHRMSVLPHKITAKPGNAPVLFYTGFRALSHFRWWPVVLFCHD